MPRWRLLFVVLVAIVGFHCGGGWYFADQLRADSLSPDHEPTSYDLAITAVGGGELGLRPVEGDDDDLTGPGIVGIDWQTGYGQLREVIAQEADGTVLRAMTRLEGEAPGVGMLADLDGAAFPGDPDRAFGLTFAEVQYQSPLGEMAAWEILAPSDLWVIHVHGLGAPRAEALRAVRPIAGAGYPQLVVTYRNDEGQPGDPSGFYRYGATEWHDVAGAVEYVLTRGATAVVLMGYSTGAAHVLSYLYQADDSPVVAAILDSPNVDFEQAVDLAASQRRLPVIPLSLPGTLVWSAKTLASIRFGLDFEAVDYVRRADQLRVPVLVFHGTDDASVPLAVSQELAAARPALVRLVIVPGAGHVRSWNLSPDAYERRLTEFLAESVP